MNDDAVFHAGEGEVEALRREVAYLRRLAEENAARMLRLDAECIGIRHELEQKRRGFRLMAELAATTGRHADHDSLFVSVSRRLNAALNMQRTVVLFPVPGGLYRPAVLRGYPRDLEADLAAREIPLDPAFLNHRVPVLVTGADPAERFRPLREALGLPYLIASPVFLDGAVKAVLVTGRLLEQQPYLPRLGRSDVETVQTVCSHLATLLAGRFLAEAEQRTQIMLDAMPLCCNFWDEHCNNIDCNLAAVRLFELADKAEYLEKFHQLSPEVQPDGLPSIDKSRAKILEAFSSGYSRFEWMHRKLDGEPIPAEITLVRVRWAKGFIVVGYTRDLREQKAILAAMHRTQEELRQARDAAERNARAKSEFLANMSHEIRTPMNAVMGMTYLLGRTELTERQRDYLDQAEHSASLLLRLINDVLDFARLDTGRIALEVVPFSLRRLMRHVHDAVRRSAGANSQRLYTTVDDDVPDDLLGDPLRMEQVLLSLSNNAVKFTPPGGKILLRVIRQADLPGKAQVRFEVEDTGIGMSGEQVAALFEPFSQGDASSTRRYGGTGLGLAVSKRIAALMEGDITCSSKVGRGSTFAFVVTLPLAAPPAAGSLPCEEGRGGDAASGGPLRGLRVLLAEDNEMNQMIAEELLTSKGIVVTAVNNGQEAIDALQGGAFDLVLMDIQMPVMDGLTATACIRANPDHEGLPIIAMTAHAMSGDREISLEGGMNDHITKPIDPDVLYATLERWAGNPESRRG